MRYGAGLAGGQLLRASLARGLGLSPRADGTTPGIRYHQFEQLERGVAGEPRTGGAPVGVGFGSVGVAAFYEQYMRALDGIGARASPALRAAMQDEAAVAFDLNIALNDAVSAVASAAL